MQGNVKSGEKHEFEYAGREDAKLESPGLCPLKLKEAFIPVLAGFKMYKYIGVLPVDFRSVFHPV